MFDSITPEMIDGFTEGERKLYDYLIRNIVSENLISPLIIRRFSQLAFLLALRSMRLNVTIPAAELLRRIFNELIHSKFISIEDKKRLRITISDALLDFNYASGNHKMISLRLMPFMTSKHITQQSKNQQEG